MSAFETYWILQASSIVRLFACLTGLCLTAAIFTLPMSYAEGLATGIKLGWKFVFCGVFFGLLTALTPTTGTLAGMYLVPRISESKAIQQDLPEIYEMAIERLKSELGKEDAK